MIEMNPYYAHCSSVGEVFDAATFSPRKAVTMAIFGVLLAAAMAVAAVHLYDPALLPMPTAKWVAEANDAIADSGKTHPLIVNIGIGVLGFLGFIFLMAALASAVDSVNPNYYFRAGPGGFSVRVPNGVALCKLGFGSRAMQLDLRWDELEKWTLVQEKRLGSMLPYESNISAYVKLKTTGGKKHAFYLDCFQESGEFIWRKLQDAIEMTPAWPSESPGGQKYSSCGQTLSAVTLQEKQQAISVSLKNLLAKTGQEKSSILSDAASGKFVQFVCSEGSVLLDLPEQTLDEAEGLRASCYFARAGQYVQEYDLFDRPGGAVVATQRSFQLNLANDHAHATQIALDLFTEVFELPTDFELIVEEI